MAKGLLELEAGKVVRLLGKRLAVIDLAIFLDRNPAAV
jgi:hypothetical protein